MKAILFLTFLLSSTTGFGQLIDELPKDESGSLNFNEVIQLEGNSKAELYLRSKQFFVDVFKSANDVIQMDDKEAGIIIGKGFNDIYIKVMGMNTPIQMWYSIKIQSKDNRYKYEIYDIYFKSYASSQVPSVTTQSGELFDITNYYKKNGDAKDVPEKYKVEMITKAKSLIIAIKSSMEKKGASPSKNSDW